MAIPAQDMFRLFSGMIDEFLAIPDILNRIVTYKQAAAYADRPTQAILFLQQLADADPIIRHLRNHSHRPFTEDRAHEIIGVAWLLHDCGPQGPHAHMVADNPDLRVWFSGGVKGSTADFDTVVRNFRRWDKQLKIYDDGTGWDAVIATALRWALAPEGAAECSWQTLIQFIHKQMYLVRDWFWWEPFA